MIICAMFVPPRVVSTSNPGQQFIAGADHTVTYGYLISASVTLICGEKIAITRAPAAIPEGVEPFRFTQQAAMVRSGSRQGTT